MDRPDVKNGGTSPYIECREAISAYENKASSMIGKGIPVSELASQWLKNPAIMAEYDALEEEFALAEAVIRECAAPCRALDQ